MKFLLKHKMKNGSYAPGDVFAALDEIWFRDREGRALYLRVNAKITEEQAVALAKAAMGRGSAER